MMQRPIFENIDAAFVKIGYRPGLIKKDYKYADLFSARVPIRTIERAIFGQEPLDYRSACFGIHIAEPNRPSKSIVHELKALGAPQIFIVNNGTTELWTITEREPFPQAEYKTANLPEIITQNNKNWNPQVIIRAKTGFAKPGPHQLDFVDVGLLPALENEAAKKIDYLLKEILHHTEGEFKKHKPPFDPSTVFKIVFSLLAAKLFRDREILNSNKIDFSFPQTALRAVNNHYGPSLTAAASRIPELILKAISQEIGQSFSLRNISVDTLTYIYENTFVSPESRQKLGIHSTPSYVADYVLSQIPIEDLPRTQWHSIDPMSGHGIFLIAAMRRMRTFLPQDWSGQERHKFFVNHLHGIEIDPFSIEVARMCLMLADFPEPNGWDLRNADVFAGKAIENAVANCMILIGNPPFENIEGRSPDTPKPIELLRRALPNLPPHAFLGLVLPRSFIDGADYKREREAVLSNFDLISITALPDRVFLYSDAETAIVIAQKQKPESRVG
ncbi:MAG: N-6 DNA methylase, partial [Alphaproteobacteria bacterium]